MANENQAVETETKPPEDAAAKPARKRRTAASVMKEQGSKPARKAAAKKVAKKAAAKKVAKKAAAKKVAKKAEDGADTRLIKADMAKYTTHQERTDGGRRRIDIGDEVAEELRTKTLDQIYKYAASVLGVPRARLEEKYNHLNTGMQRMNLGNRIRAAARNASGEDASA